MRSLAIHSHLAQTASTDLTIMSESPIFPGMRKTVIANCVVLLVLLVLLSVSASGADLLSGTWKQNVAKSKYAPGPGFQNNTVNFESIEGGMKFSADGIDGRGKRIQNGYTLKFDGKDYPTHQLVDGKPNPNAADFVSWKKIDDYTYEQTNKFEGKVLTVARHVISKDGKTRTVTTTGVTPQGEKLTNHLVFDKQ